MTSPALHRLSCLLFGATCLVAACSDDAPAEDEESTSGSEEGDGDGDGDGDGGGDGDGDGDPALCEPPADASAVFYLDGGPRNTETDWNLLCTSAGAQLFGDGWLLEFEECESQTEEPGPAFLYLVLEPQPVAEPFLTPGTPVRLRYVERPPFIGGYWFTIHDAVGGTLLLAGLAGPSLMPTPEEAPGFDYAPLSVEQVSAGCVPFEHDSQCGLARRDGLRVGFDGLETIVLDANSGFIGDLLSYQIIVGSALEFSEVICDDFGPRELSALFILTPEG